ncbi:porphobilinogen synthase [Geobacter sulfurreducens]|jgi:porphobilinogen synthase|uniref:Delta-aminolevulinic acid dehydratase n=1 Tax=Geobacter sulfurreducens (strain ATCC 51573 / DSM 12127 / PCA) TaxID=243231 RepID=Q74GV9_GEOSL|nr:porphobilinogen synthase [Geobacter sulfurreducens]BET59977.1 porphobilinogen synthase [Geobacter sp. 60473]AAR33470.1 porphobilinogen synthase [Geobacter sulfurreducens PCA]ADI82974.1 porphobilinogen synthase [Geobacter sulfurreducens KN400]AJY69872.1 delta-aminolevulinic acid dehydratase [Geobacter sulfurreducens]QVW35413.1 porphobilinogen synthase [Geobacter sulfurreducens]
MFYPTFRARRIRGKEVFRRMVSETTLSATDLIYPMFSAFGTGIRKEISSMPGIYQQSIEHIVAEAQEVHELGVPAVILFGIPETKDAVGSDAYAEHGIIQETIRALKKQVPGLAVITDVCMCEYTDHGHCGIIKDGDVDNDETLELLAREALSHAEAGADMVAPSDMMDGRVMAIREILDNNGYKNIPIMSYAVKYASGYYGPFREAAESTPQFGDRRSYQMDPGNRREAIREARMDVEEGADIIMVKPGLPYLDIVRDLREEFDLPVAVYNVSGEYSMIKAAGRAGWIDEERVMMETLLSFKRAGADLILTYHAKEAARVLKRG